MVGKRAGQGCPLDMAWLLLRHKSPKVTASRARASQQDQLASHGQYQLRLMGYKTVSQRDGGRGSAQGFWG